MELLANMYRDFNYEVERANIPDAKSYGILINHTERMLQKCRSSDPEARTLLIVHYGGHGYDRRDEGLVLIPMESTEPERYVGSFAL